MEIAMTIIATLILFLAVDLIFLAFTKALDYIEKGNKKKTYKLGFFRFFMVRYRRLIQSWEIEKQSYESQVMLPIDLINAKTISKLAFWLQIINMIFFIAVMGTGIARAINPETILIFRTVCYIWLGTLPIPGVIYGIKNHKINLKLNKTRKDIV